MQAIGYARVSTDEQAGTGLGLGAQREAIRAAAELRGWELVGTVEDAGASGKDLSRPGIARALEMLAAGEAEALVVAKLDRLSRSVSDFAACLDRSRREGWGFVALDLGVDTTTAAGELVANVMASVAQWERRAIGERTREALAAKRREGVQLGRPVSLSADVEARIVAAREAGASLRAIADELTADEVPTAQGGARWYASTVRGVLARAAA